MESRGEVKGQVLHLLRLQGKVPGEGVVWVGRDELTREFAEGTVSAESRKGWRWEDVASSGIPLEVAKMLEDYMLYATADGVEGEDKGDSVLVTDGGRGSKSRAAGYRGDPSESLIYNGRGEPPFP